MIAYLVHGTFAAIARACTHPNIKTALTSHSTLGVAAKVVQRDMSSLAVCCLHSISWAGIWMQRMLVHTGEESFLKILHVETHRLGRKMRCNPLESVILSLSKAGRTQKKLEAQESQVGQRMAITHAMKGSCLMSHHPAHNTCRE